MTQEQNPYSPATQQTEPLAEQIRRQSTWAAALGVAGLLIALLFAPFAVYLGHKCLGRIRAQGVGLEHRGAALVGATLGWLGSAYFVIVVLVEVVDFVGP